MALCKIQRMIEFNGAGVGGGGWGKHYVYHNVSDKMRCNHNVRNNYVHFPECINDQRGI